MSPTNEMLMNVASELKKKKINVFVRGRGIMALIKSNCKIEDAKVIIQVPQYTKNKDEILESCYDV